MVDMTLVAFRCEDMLIEGVDQLAAGNDLNRSEMIRLLVRRGIRSVVDENGGSVAPGEGRPIRKGRARKPDPKHDAVLASRAGHKGDLRLAASIINTGDAVSTGTCLAAFVGILIDEYEDPEGLLDRLSAQLDQPKKTRQRALVNKGNRLARS
jgi:hypothetical protein